MRALQILAAALAASSVAVMAPSTAFADDVAVDPTTPQPVQVATVPTADDADPAAVAACASFAEALDGTSVYYGDFADAFEGSSYSDPSVSDSNVLGLTALREAAAVAMSGANTAGLQPEIAAPMRTWSLDATKLLVKMGLRIPGDSLNSTATEMNNDATTVQEACAAAGTHA